MLTEKTRCGAEKKRSVGRPRNAVPKFPKFASELENLDRERYTTLELAQMFGVSKEHVRVVLRQFGILAKIENDPNDANRLNKGFYYRKDLHELAARAKAAEQTPKSKVNGKGVDM